MSAKHQPDVTYYQDQWAKWDEMKSYGPMSRHVRRIVSSLVKDMPVDSIVDAGCGVGTLLQDLANIFPNASLTGTELYQDSLAIARQRLPQATFKQLDLTKRYLRQKADLVLCIDVFEHIPADVKAMTHLRKMTGKYTVIVVPLGPLFEIETKRVGHVHGYSRAEFDQKLHRAGFEIVKTTQWGFPFYNLYRRLLHRLPESSTTGRFSPTKKLTSQLMYMILWLNCIPFWGERYFVVCRPKK